MLPDCKICWFCVHAKHEKRCKKVMRIYRYCELGLKRIGASHHEDFNRCKGFEPNAETILKRQTELHQVIRDCRVELGYLDRLETYMEHKRRRGAVYEKVHTHYMPLYRGEDEGKTDSAGGFEKGEKQ